MRFKNPSASGTTSVNQDVYDFSGPLWNKYFNETRKKVRFPRGYKEVSSLRG
jgi:hypothetical protein